MRRICPNAAVDAGFSLSTCPFVQMPAKFLLACPKRWGTWREKPTKQSKMPHLQAEIGTMYNYEASV